MFLVSSYTCLNPAWLRALDSFPGAENDDPSAMEGSRVDDFEYFIRTLRTVVLRWSSLSGPHATSATRPPGLSTLRISRRARWTSRAYIMPRRAMYNVNGIVRKWLFSMSTSCKLMFD